MGFQQTHPPETRELAKTMFESGARLVAIVARVGAPRSTVRYWAKTDGWVRPDKPEESRPPRARKARPRGRGERLEHMQRAYDELLDATLWQQRLVIALPNATPPEIERLERETRRLNQLWTILSRQQPLLKAEQVSAQPSRRPHADVSDPPDHGALLEEVARRFDAFDAAEPAAGTLEDADPGATPGVS